MSVLVGSESHFQRVQVIRCDIRPRLAERSRDDRNEKKIQRVLPLRPISHSAIFFEERIRCFRDTFYN
jgi:hypothetical protein